MRPFQCPLRRGWYVNRAWSFLPELNCRYQAGLPLPARENSLPGVAPFRQLPLGGKGHVSRSGIFYSRKPKYFPVSQEGIAARNNSFAHWNHTGRGVSRPKYFFKNTAGWPGPAEICSAENLLYSAMHRDTREECVLHANCQGEPVARLLGLSPEFSGALRVTHYTNYTRGNSAGSRVAKSDAFSVPAARAGMGGDQFRLASCAAEPKRRGCVHSEHVFQRVLAVLDE